MTSKFTQAPPSDQTEATQDDTPPDAENDASLQELLVEPSVLSTVDDINARIAALNALVTEAPVPVGEDLTPGIRMDQDWDNLRDIRAQSQAGLLLNVQASENEESRWTALHVVLGPLDLHDLDVLGVVVHSLAAERATVTRVCLRSGNGNKFRDFFFEKHMVSTTEAGIHVDLCRFADCPEIPLTAEWRDLIFFFSNKEIDITLTKLRVFAA